MLRDSRMLLVSWVCGPSAGDRHSLWQLLILFQNEKACHVSLVMLLVSWVCGPSAGNRHPLWQLLILFQNEKACRVSLVHSNVAICRIAGVARRICLCFCRRGGEESFGIPLRRFPRDGV